jgi:hypothetical protein
MAHFSNEEVPAHIMSTTVESQLPKQGVIERGVLPSTYSQTVGLRVGEYLVERKMVVVDGKKTHSLSYRDLRGNPVTIDDPMTSMQVNKGFEQKLFG